MPINTYVDIVRHTHVIKCFAAVLFQQFHYFPAQHCYKLFVLQPEMMLYLDKNFYKVL